MRSLSSVIRFRTLIILGCACGICQAATPLPMARSYDSVGLGMIMAAGPVYGELHGLAPNKLLVQGWFHYSPTLLGGIGIELSSQNPSTLESTNVGRYDITSTWIPWSTSAQALELSLIGSLTRTNTYLDTLVGADPVADIGTDAGIALRVGYGERVSDRVGWWVGGTTSVGIRLIGTNPGLNPSFDAEAGVTWSLMDIWKDAQTLSRSFDLFARLPLQVQSAAPCVIPSGATRRPTWSAGLQVGISVLF